MIETTKYIRKSFFVDAVQVSAQNMDNVAAWVEGKIVQDGDLKSYVLVEVPRAAHQRQKQAYVGDWVLYNGVGFQVYIDRAFKRAFDNAGESSTMHATTTDQAPTEADFLKAISGDGVLRQRTVGDRDYFEYDTVQEPSVTRPVEPTTFMSAEDTATVTKEEAAAIEGVSPIDEPTAVVPTERVPPVKPSPADLAKKPESSEPYVNS